MNVLSRIAAGVARREGLTSTFGLTLVHVRSISSSSGIEKYLAPYPSLPKIDSKELGPPPSVAHPSPPTSLPTGTPSDFFMNLMTYDLSVPERTASDRWISVHDRVLRELKAPGNVYTGRSVPVTEKMDVPSAYRRLHSILNRNRVRSELFLQRRYEKPSDRERRLRSERHRRRFAAWIRKKVQLVSEIRRRG